MTYTSKYKIPGHIVLIDFLKAFDTMQLESLFKTLEKIILALVYQLDKNVIFQCLILCWMPNINPTLFLVAQIIAIHIRQNEFLKGLIIGGYQYVS